jgi:hypothetical protein
VYDEGYIPVTMYNKAAVYSTELQKLFCGYGLYDQGYIPVAMYNKAVLHSTELQQLFCGYRLCMIRVTVL